MNSASSSIFALPSGTRKASGSGRTAIGWGATAFDLGRERRRRDVRWGAKSGSLSATLGGVPVELLDLSATGMRLRMPIDLGVGTSSEIDLDLFQNDVRIGRVRLSVAHATPSPVGALVGGRVVRSDILSSAKAPAPKAGDVVEIRDELIKSRLLEGLALKPVPALMRCESGSNVSGVIEAGKGSSFLFRATEESESLPHGETVSLEVALNRTELVLEAVAQTGEANVRVLSPITRILSVSRRRCERVSLVPGVALLSWQDPMDPDTVVSASVVDLSADGLAIELGANNHHLLPAAPSSLTLRLRDARVALLGEVHSVRVVDGGSRIVGLHIKPLHDKDRLRLGRICQALRFPSLLSRRDADPHDIAELMRTSGYLDLRDGTTPSRTWHESSGDESLGVDLVQQAENGALLGHLSCTRIYPRTWIYHQLATVGLRRDRVAYPLYSQLLEWIHTLSDGQGYLLAYFNQKKTWHQTMMGAFTRWAGSEALSLLAKLDRFEPAEGSEARSSASRHGVVVREATVDELPFAADLARSLLPPLLSDALHFGASSMSTATLCREHADAGLERARTTLVAEVDGEIVGIAACETGAASLSLFNILNTAHVFFRDLVAPGIARAAQGALLKGVRDFYLARGVALPLIVSPAGNTRYAADAGLAYAETMGAWVTSAEGLKQWRNYIHFEMGGRAHRGRRQEKMQ